MSSLSKVTIGIKTFLRDPLLFHTIVSIRKNLPEVKMIIADDGEMTEEKDGIYADIIREGHQVVLCPFDSGFGYKSNRIAKALQTEYLLIGSDDFDFSPSEARTGIERLIDVLFLRPGLAMASGRVNNRPYEFMLDESDGAITETPCRFDDSVSIGVCDLTVNYGLIQASVFDNVRWDDDVKIGGGEHGAFFVDLKREGYKVAWVRDVNINEQQQRGDARYMSYRQRALSSERPCFDKRGIKKYVCGNGQIDYEVKQ